MAIRYSKILRPLVAIPALCAILGVNAANQYLDVVSEKEGLVEYGYMDPANIPTKCFGDTTNVTLGKKYTFAECERSLNEHSVEILKPVKKCIKNFDQMPDKTKVALASMSYNIGSGKMCAKNSSVKNLANAGNWTRMCRRINEVYKYAIDRKTGKKVAARGLSARRKFESELCLQGLREAGLL